jgi:RHS repeat-associated protein
MAYADPDAVTQIANGLSTTTFTYDNNGNVTQKTVDGTTTTYVYDYANRLTALGAGGATTTYAYDWAGNRVSQTGTTTTYLYPFKWYSVASSTGTGAKFATTTDYVFNGDTLLATVDQQSASGVATGSPSTRYIHPDHLGSTNVVTNESGAVVQTMDYYPYGGTRISVSTSTKERRQFIGQFTDDSTLSYLNARYYDGGRGQFVTQDPVFLGDPKSQNLVNPQSLNTYSYSADNPIVKKDPSGRDDAGVVDALPSALQLLGGLGLAGTSEFWGPVAAVGVLGTVAAITAGDAIYNFRHNSANPTPGLSEATRLVSGDGEGPININPKGPKIPKTAVLIAFGVSLLTLGVCGSEAGYDECSSILQGYSNYLNGNKTNTNQTPQASLLVSSGSGAGVTSNWSYSQLQLYTTPSGAVVRSDGTLLSGPPGSGGGGGGGGGYYSSNGQTPVTNSYGATGYCLGVCKR